MEKIGRNDLCLCGSGKKYKKCCLIAHEAAASQLREERNGVTTAIDWLYEKYPEEVATALNLDFLGGPDESMMDAIDELPEELDTELSINMAEWVLADANLSIDGNVVKAVDLVLGPDGPQLSAHARRWIAQIASTPVSLYEVREIVDEEVLLMDLLTPSRPLLSTSDKSLARHAVPGDIFGVRLVQREGSLVFTGSIYPMERETALFCVEEIQKELQHAAEPEQEREIATLTIVDLWLTELLPELHEDLPEYNSEGNGALPEEGNDEKRE